MAGDIDVTTPEARTELRCWLTQKQTQCIDERYSLLRRRQNLLDAKFAGSLAPDGEQLLTDVRSDLDVIAAEQQLIPIALAFLDAYEAALREIVILSEVKAVAEFMGWRASGGFSPQDFAAMEKQAREEETRIIDGYEI